MTGSVSQVTGEQSGWGVAATHPSALVIGGPRPGYHEGAAPMEWRFLNGRMSLAKCGIQRYST